MSLDLQVPRRALAIGAHPDDIEFGCGATLAKWTAAGTDAHLLVLTDGSKGTWDPDTDRAELASIREREQRAAVDALGASEASHLGLVDGELVAGHDERARVCEVIRRIRPDVILGHDPWKRYRLHPDHRAAGFLTIDALVAARDAHFFPEQGFAPHRPEALLLFEAQDVDHLERADGECAAAKVGALLAHRSQWRSTMQIDPDAPDADAQRAAFAGRVRDELARVGGDAGPAEGFKLIVDV